MHTLRVMMTKMVIGIQEISFNPLDKGAQANVLQMKVFETVTRRVELQPTQTILSAFVNSVKVKPASTVTLQCIPENAGCADFDRVICDQPHQPTSTRLSNL